MIRPSHTEKQLLDSVRTAEPVPQVLQRSSDAERCTQLFRALLIRAAGALRNGIAVMETLLNREAAELPDPERALLHLDRFLEASLNPTTVLEDMLRTPDLLRRFFRLVAASEWLADTMVRDASLFRWLLTTDVLTQAPSQAEITEMAQSAMRRFPPGRQRLNALRRMQRRELLRIAAADVLGLKDMGSVLAELSALADAVVGCAYEDACDRHAQRYGTLPDTRVVILALGKLGGRELNYSSDIDLMVVYDSPDTDAGRAVRDLVKETVRILTEVTPEGMLYRTDLRLRPDGSAGALALSLDATLAYYETRGALWERQMLLRARSCAGDQRFGREVLEALVPFVYPRTRLRLPSELAGDVQRRLRERHDAERNVKHMSGGIRHIEFSLQVQQMLHAPRITALRTPSTLQSIDVLAAASLLSLEEEALLRDAYLFLRRVEHAIQLERFEQSHDLPSDSGELARIAWLLRMPNSEALEARLHRTRTNVQRICDGMLGSAGVDEESEQLPSGFRDREATQRLHKDLAEGRDSRPFDGSSRERMRSLLPVLMQESAQQPLPDEALLSLERLFYRASIPSALIGVLEQAPARRLLLRLAALAPAALRWLENDPLALELVFTGYDAALLSPQRLQRVRDISALGRYMLGDIDLGTCSQELTDTADSILRAAMQRVEAPFVVLAMGKYGGCELIPGSDLDVIFLGEDDRTDEAAQKSAAALIGELQASAEGRLYEVDARLRPEGGSAPLVLTRSAWLRYHEQRASLWELQSLLRARVVAGETDLTAAIDGDISHMLRGHELTPQHVQQIRGMREQMEPQNRFRREDFLDIKRSAGGLVDCEFAAQLLALSRRQRSAGNTAHSLGESASALPALRDTLERMRETHLMLRNLQLLFRVLLDIPGNLYPADPAQQRLLALAMGRASTTELLDTVKERMQQNRKDFDAVCTTLISPEGIQESTP